MTLDTDFLAKWMDTVDTDFFSEGKKIGALAPKKKVDSDSRVVGALAFFKYKQVL